MAGISFRDLLEKYEIKELGLLHVDTEGADFEIIKQLDFGIIRPNLILYEKGHLKERDMEKSILFLEEQYHLFDFGMDTLAVNRELKNTKTHRNLKTLRALEQAIRKC